MIVEVRTHVRATFSKIASGRFSPVHLLATAHEVKRPFQNSTADVGSAAFTSKRAAFAAALGTSFRDRYQNATNPPGPGRNWPGFIEREIVRLEAEIELQ